MAQATELDKSVLRLVQNFLTDLDTPRSLAVFILLRYEQWDQLAELKFDPHQYAVFWPEGKGPTIQRVKRDYQATDLLRKAKFLPLDDSKAEEAAIETWLQSERQCKLAELRLEPFRDDALGVYQDDPQFQRVRKFFGHVKKKVRQVLGVVPDQIEPAFGPGSVWESAGVVPSDELVLLDKLDRLQPHVSPSAADLFRHYWNNCLWSKAADWPQPILVSSNRFATVPKTASTRRSIGVAPGGNLWLQLGIGKHMRRRLQRFGLLLPEGKSEQLHHRYAQRGSVDDSVATVDLSNASDTISHALVRLLLPDEWLELLEACRETSTVIPGRGTFQLKKFSAMGNGFTFELETLIFYCLAKTVYDLRGDVTGPVSVYGDDIIVPTEIAGELVSLLRLCGFTPNTRKTFVQGNFRESCGGDYYLGIDVTPFRMTDSPSRPEDWIAICNGLHSRWDREIPGDPAYRAWKVAHSQVPQMLRRCQSSPEYGDCAIHWDNPRLKWSRDHHAWVPLLISRPAVKLDMRRHSSTAILCYALLGGDPEGPSPRRRSDGPIRIGPPSGVRTAPPTHLLDPRWVQWRKLPWWVGRFWKVGYLD